MDPISLGNGVIMYPARGYVYNPVEDSVNTLPLARKKSVNMITSLA
ncbi:MAG: hypothetical protein ACE5DK_06720 [Paracoccaceae bacterium]